MRVLCFHPSIAPYRVDFFNLLSRRCDFSMVFLDKDENCAKYDVEACKARITFPFKYLTVGFNFMGRFIRFGIVTAIRDAKPDIVISYEYSWVTLLLSVYRKLCRSNFKLYTYTDDNPEIISRYGVLRSRLCQFVLTHLDGMIVTGQRTEKALRERYNIPASIRLCRVPIIHDEASYRNNATTVLTMAKELRRKYDKSSKGVVLFVGRLVSIKGIDWVINVYAKKSLDLPNLVILGEGELQREIDEKVSRAGLDGKIHRIGFQHGIELSAYFAMANCLLLPSRFEPYGAVVPEALLWGTPCVVSTNVGAQELIEPGLNGEIIQFGDDEGLRRSIMKWAATAWSTKSLLGVRLSDCVNDLVRNFAHE